MGQTSLAIDAPELSCDGNKLSGASVSDGGHPIVGLLFTDEADLNAAPIPPAGSQGDDPTFGYGDMCLKRRSAGYDSGMGLIFHLVAKINPIPNSPALPLPGEQSELQQKNEVFQDFIGPHKTAKHGGVFTIGWMLLVVFSIACLVLFVLRVRGHNATDVLKAQNFSHCSSS